MSVPAWNATFADTEDLYSLEFRQMFYDAVVERIGPANRYFKYVDGSSNNQNRVNQGGVINPNLPSNSTGSTSVCNGSYRVTAIDVNGKETLASPVATIIITSQQFLVAVNVSWSAVGNDVNGNPPVGYNVYGNGAVAGLGGGVASSYATTRRSANTANPCLLVRLPATATSWIDSGISFPAVDHPIPTSTTSTLPTPSTPTLSVHKVAGSLSIYAGDDAQSCFQSPNLGAKNDLLPELMSGSIADMQFVAQLLLSWYKDPSTYASGYAAGPPYLATMIATTLVSLGSSSEYHNVCTKTGTTLWRRRRPREINLPASVTSYSTWAWNSSSQQWTFANSSLTPPDGARANAMVWNYTPNPNGPKDGSDAPVATFIGVYKYTAATSSWAADTTPGARADILDSTNTPTGGYYISPGVMQHGDFIGPWIFNELRDVLNACTTTDGYNGPQMNAAGYSGINLGSALPTWLVADNYESLGVNSSGTKSTAAAAYSSASSAIAGSSPGTYSRDSPPTIGAGSAVYAQIQRLGYDSPPDYRCTLQMVQFNPALMLWGGSACHVAVQMQYALAGTADASDLVAFNGEGQFGATGTGWTTWHAYDVAAVSADYYRYDMDQWGSVATAPVQPASAPPATSSSTTSLEGLQLNGIYAVITWTFAHNAST